MSAAATRCPTPVDFQAAARRAGISAGSTVVAYDEAGEGGAARLWWLLRHHGHDARGGARRRPGGLARGRRPARAGPRDPAEGDPRARATRRADDTVDASATADGRSC